MSTQCKHLFLARLMIWCSLYWLGLVKKYTEIFFHPNEPRAAHRSSLGGRMWQNSQPDSMKQDYLNSSQHGCMHARPWPSLLHPSLILPALPLVYITFFLLSALPLLRLSSSSSSSMWGQLDNGEQSTLTNRLYEYLSSHLFSAASVWLPRPSTVTVLHYPGTHKQINTGICMHASTHTETTLLL